LNQHHAAIIVNSKWPRNKWDEGQTSEQNEFEGIDV